jgi:D-threo-aldose 1-dehydrogenase
MNPFEKVSLGKSNLVVTRFGLGGDPLAGLFTDVPEGQAIATARRALQAGVNLFDTAPLYGLGKSEDRIGKALQGVDRDSYVLASKVGPSWFKMNLLRKASTSTLLPCAPILITPTMA